MPASVSLDDILCLKHTRRVRNDNTIQFRSQVIDLPPAPRSTSLARQQVQIFEAFDGTLRVIHQARVLSLVWPGMPLPPVRRKPSGHSVSTSESRLNASKTQQHRQLALAGQRTESLPS